MVDWSRASVKGKKQREEENGCGPFYVYAHFQSKCFSSAGILLHEVEDVAAKWLFTLVRISVVKHCPFFPRITGKFKYPLASSLVLPDNKINSSYWVVTYFIAVLIKSGSLEEWFFRHWAFAPPVSRNCCVGQTSSYSSQVPICAGSKTGLLWDKSGFRNLCHPSQTYRVYL